MTFVKENPEEPEPTFLLAQIWLRTDEFDKAEALLNKCVQIMPESPSPLLMLAQLKFAVNDFESADGFYQNLVLDFPSYAHGYFSFAGFQQARGNLVMAISLLRKVLDIDNQHSGAFLALTQLVSDPERDTLVKEMLALVSRLESKMLASNAAEIEVVKQDIMKLNYALGYCLDKRNDYTEAFKFWKNANQIQYKQCRFKVSQMLPFYSSLKGSFSDFYSQRSGGNVGTLLKEEKTFLTPILVVGMPRSGSTLLEQMLSNHSKISTAGEVNILSSTVVEKLQSFTGKNYPLGIDELTQEQCKTLGKLYLDELQKHHPSSQFIIDKLPANFQSIGLVKLILPHAIIVHLNREPEAIALSIFKNYFAANEPYFCNLEQLAEYMSAYQDLMRFWKTHIPSAYINIAYSQLVDSPQSTLEGVLNICKLKWEDDCMNYYQNSNVVSTLSDIQAKKPIYKSSVARWHCYRNVLEMFNDKTEFYNQFQ